MISPKHYSHTTDHESDPRCGFKNLKFETHENKNQKADNLKRFEK